MPDIILETHNLRKAFGALVAVDDVSIQVQAGTIHSIIGPNGAGKTTFFPAQRQYRANVRSGDL
jgi:branched-chain amino acid transport system ATP-binding protein